MKTPTKKDSYLLLFLATVTLWMFISIPLKWPKRSLGSIIQWETNNSEEAVEYSFGWNGKWL